MTDLQDAICDRLVGASIGPNWIGGPFHVAALVSDPKFEPWHRSDGRPGQYARMVGWPVDFCEAVTGANSVLESEDDRRSLAISLFSRVTPPGPVEKSAPVRRKLRTSAAAWAVMRGHESACGVDCPLHREAKAGLAKVEEGEKWPGLFLGRLDCASAPGMWSARVSRSSTAAHHAAVSMRYLDQLTRNPKNSNALADAFRESAKAETKVHSLVGATAFCLAIAAKLELIPSELVVEPGSDVK